MEHRRGGQTGVTHSQVRVTFGVDHTVITIAWTRYQQHGSPVSRHGLDRQEDGGGRQS